MEDAKVIASVKSVYSGISVFGDGVYRVMKKRMEEGGALPKQEVSGDEETSLTARELDVVKLVAQGYDNKEIAAELYLAEGTVRNQISKILEKLELKDRTQLAVYAVKHGLDE
ncbi:MAG: response regulator transcription factor [Lachnospiraceae bacterium]|nr:response regulator transcription factor [Lachnospiraceae bacterium]